MDVIKYPIIIAGCGPGAADYITPAVRLAVESTELLIGAQRLLNLFPEVTTRCIPYTGDSTALIGTLEACREHQRITVLVSGDVGLFSLARTLVQHFGKSSCQLIPGVSSIQVAFARIGLDWHDVRIISAHSEIPEVNIMSGSSPQKIAILGGHRDCCRWLAQWQEFLGDEYVFWQMKDLTLLTEKVCTLSINDTVGLRDSVNTIFLVIHYSLLEEME